MDRTYIAMLAIDSVLENIVVLARYFCQVLMPVIVWRRLRYAQIRRRRRRQVLNWTDVYMKRLIYHSD